MVEVNRYIIIENTNHPICTRITVTKNQYGYIIGLKNDLKKIFPAKLLDRLFKNHLYQNIESAYNDYNNYWSLQRLVCCLYTKISDKVVHHINKLKMVNNITNLLPVTREEHTQLEDYDENEMLVQKMQVAFKKKVNRCKNQTVANNDDVILQVLKLASERISKNNIVKTMSKYVKKSSVYAILKDFFYSKEFVEALEGNNIIDVSEFNGIMRERWRKIIEFEKLLI